MLNDLLDPLAGCMDAESLQRLINLGIAPAVQERMSVLAAKANEGLLSEDEQSEYEAAINGTDIIAILKFKAQTRLAAATLQ